jgi:hypothetical protein
MRFLNKPGNPGGSSLEGVVSKYSALDIDLFYVDLLVMN